MLLAATQMDLEIVIMSEVRQTEKGNIIWYHLHVESKKKKKKKKRVQMKLSTKQSYRCRKQTWLSGVNGERDELGDREWHIHIAIYKIAIYKRASCI